MVNAERLLGGRYQAVQDSWGGLRRCVHVVNGLNDYGMINHSNKWMQGHLLVPGKGGIQPRIERAGLALHPGTDMWPVPVLQDNKPFICFAEQDECV